MEPGMRRTLIIVLLIALAGASPGRVRAQVDAGRDADREATAGEKALEQGDFATAIDRWALAARLYSEAGRGGAQAFSLLRLAEAQQALGGYSSARSTLELSRTLIERTDDRRQRALVLGALGNVLSTLARAESHRDQRLALSSEAGRSLGEALSLAENSNQPEAAAAIRINLANHDAAEGNVAAALKGYLAGADLATRAGRPSLAARALANHARVAQRSGAWDVSESSLASAQGLLTPQLPSHEKAFTLTSVGYSYVQLARARPTTMAAVLPVAERAFEEAAATAQQIGDKLALSYAYGYRGALHEEARRPTSALDLTRRALFAAMEAQDRFGHFSGGGAGGASVGVTAAAGDALYRWHYQLGRLHAAGGRRGEAIDAARRAVEVLQSIRFDISTGYGVGQVSFRETVEPVFHLLVGLLLEQSRQSGGSGDQARRRTYIEEARTRVEELKAAELRDYFGDDCVDALLASERPASEIDPAAAVVYPVLLEDRTEILVSLPGGGLEQISVNVGRNRVSGVVGEFRRCITNASCFEFFSTSRQLYDWLVRPIESHLRASNVRTLIFVPDGPLRTVPMAALYDGDRYLIQRYAVATIPALNLVDPRPLQSGQTIRVLRAGMSDAVGDLAMLPHVKKELEGIAAYYPDGELLLNDDFTPERLNALLARNGYNIVHVASHGEFRNDASDAYLQTKTGRLPMNDLAGYIGQLRFRGLPSSGSGAGLAALELLVLSACETAEGDERAALGLAGLAIKAGARSALGTLWTVNDQAAAALVVEFYRQLRTTPGVSKAEALRQAQITALEGQFDHPQYWSAFLLISNWL
jgi:CHAT domain-containing protein